MTDKELRQSLEDTTKNTEENIKKAEKALNDGAISKNVLFGILKVCKTQTKLVKKLILLIPCFKQKIKKKEK